MMATRLHSLKSVRRAAQTALMYVILTAAVASAALAQEDAAERDLQGILPDYIPNGLSEDDFRALQDNWAGWSAETGRLVSDFYASDDDDVRGRRATLGRINTKLATMEQALGDRQYLSIHGPLADLYGRLSRRIAVSGALLDTIEQETSAVAQTRFQVGLNDLGGRAAALRANFEKIIDGDKWVSYLRLNEIEAAAQSGEYSQSTVQSLVNVQQKLHSRSRLGRHQREFLSREAVLDFEDSLNATLVFLQEVDGAARQERLRDLAAQLLEAIELYEGEPTTENMEAVRHIYDDIRRIAPDGGARLTKAMRRHYLNYNLRVVVDETLLQDILRDTRMESGYINEMISGARITGCQWTNATVNMDLKPSNTGVHFDLILNGTIRSSAQGETHVATVYATGRHCFTARKQVHFDGDRFQHWCATVGAGGGNCPYAAETCLSWAPLLGGASENFALKVANDRAPEANAQTLSKIRREVASQFNRETGTMLSDAEVGLQDKVAGPLREGGYYPDIKEFRSTETDMHMRTRLMESGELGGGDILPLPLYPTHGALVQLHESLLNQIGDRLELDGKRFTPDQLQAYLEEEISSITGQEADLGDLGGESDDPNSPKVEEIIFHDADAARFQVRGGEVVLILSMGLKLEGREEIPPQRISVPLSFAVAGDVIAMQRGTVGVSPIGPVPPRERGQQIARAGVMRNKIEEAFEPQELDATFTLQAGEKDVNLRVTDLRARSGWLSIIATDGVSESVEPTDGPSAQQRMQYVRGQQSEVTR